MRSLRIHGAGDIRLDDVPAPVPGDADVVLKVDACGVCGSDLGYIAHGRLRADGAPLPLGHEAAGTVIEVGSAVTAFTVGDRVLVNPMTHRHNIIGNGGSEGAFAERMLIHAPVLGQQLIRLPKTVSAERAAIVEPLAVALRAINRAALQPQERVVVLGAGPIGLGAVHWLARRGFSDIAVVDRSQERLQRAGKLGAHHLIDTTTQDLAEALMGRHGEGAPLFGKATVGSDVYFDMAGAAALLQDVIGSAKSGARLVLTALYKDAVPIDLRTFLLREMSLISATGYVDEMASSLAMLSNAGAELDTYISHRFDFSDVVAAVDAARDPASGKIMVLFD